MFDISKLPKPDLIKDYDLAKKTREYINKVKEKVPEWDAANADPMTKVLKALAEMDVLRIQHTNETARKLLLAFAKSADLDNIRPDIERMRGSNPIAKLKITYRNPDSVSGIIQAGTEFRGDKGSGEDATVGYFKAKTYFEYTITPETDGTQIIEAEIYEGGSESVNDIKINRLLIASPVIESVEIDSIIEVGSDDTESDERYKQRILLAPTSNMGGKRSYMFYAMSADLRIKEVYIETTAPGCLTIHLLPTIETLKSSEYHDEAQNIKQHVEDALSDDNNRPCADIVDVRIDGIDGVYNIASYSLSIDIHLLPGASQKVIEEVKEKAASAVRELYSFGRDITKNIIAGMCWVEGVSGFDITIKRNGITVEDIRMNRTEAAVCFEEDITVNHVAVDGGLTDV